MESGEREELVSTDERAVADCDLRTVSCPFYTPEPSRWVERLGVRSVGNLAASSASEGEPLAPKPIGAG